MTRGIALLSAVLLLTCGALGVAAGFVTAPSDADVHYARETAKKSARKKAYAAAFADAEAAAIKRVTPAAAADGKRQGTADGLKTGLKRVYVPQVMGGPEFQPTSIIVGNYRPFSKISYKDYGGFVASATAVMEIKTCVPSCADGFADYYDVGLKLSRVKNCTGVMAYTRADYRFVDRKPPNVTSRNGFMDLGFNCTIVKKMAQIKLQQFEEESAAALKTADQ